MLPDWAISGGWASAGKTWVGETTGCSGCWWRKVQNTLVCKEQRVPEETGRKTQGFKPVLGPWFFRQKRQTIGLKYTELYANPRTGKTSEPVKSREKCSRFAFQWYGLWWVRSVCCWVFVLTQCFRWATPETLRLLVKAQRSVSDTVSGVECRFPPGLGQQSSSRRTRVNDALSQVRSLDTEDGELEATEMGMIFL